MPLSHIKRILTSIPFLLFSTLAMAGGVADFSVGSKSKVTLNPAGAATIDRILFDFTTFTYKGGNRLSPFNNQYKESGSQTYLHAAYDCSGVVCYDDVDHIEFDEGETNGLHIDFAYPNPYFTIGISYDYRSEEYEDGYYVSSSGDSYENADDNIKAEYKHNIGSYFLAVPFGRLSVGFRRNHKSVLYRFDRFDGFGFYQTPASWASSSFDIYNNGKIEGTANYQFDDYGILYHVLDDQPLLDVNFFHRPSSTARFEFKDIEIDGTTNGSSGVSMEDFNFVEPGINMVGVNIVTRSGNILMQMLLEAGNNVDEEESLVYLVKESKSERNRAFDIIGYLFRVAFYPNLDLAYGYKGHEIAGSLTEVTTIAIKAPFPFYPDLIVSLGTSQTKVSDDEDEVVAENRSFAFSFNLKVGKPVQKRALRLKPKTKTLPPGFP